MALEHALLVSLSEREGSGYELARRFDRSIGFFWAATHQQIYRVLRRMEEAGWVTHTDVAQEGRPDKKVYRVAKAGAAELTRWLAEPIEPTMLRDELGVKLRGASLGDQAAVLREVERHRAEHAARLEAYRAIECRDFPRPAKLSGRELHQYLVLRGGVRAEQSFTEWCDEVVRALRSDGAR
ncbi:transcriptional regulator, PadR-like family [Kribbella flavida DSM 17836]|uniref:Transcriptional regulator, PadR-like family n=1 Tax=Kribbella flavida (strain DSM 17836 / JCM 10339 / NBRC 14399) TaxID=479435 RepID=D2PRD5_KRIFD|nr:PadR family transcriptional regulator [Kribbella flavida]ADB34853.1 transcriptional regulator, PadR-like family [Kribbella flavida DSM 17836]